MLEEFILILLIIAIAIALLSVRLLFGKKEFVHTHIDGNAEMERRGIRCVKSMDRQARLNGGLKIQEHSCGTLTKDKNKKQ